MKSEIEALLDQRVDIDGTALARTLARVQKHVFDDQVRAFAVLHHLVEIALQHVGDLFDLRAQLGVERRSGKRLPQFVDQLNRDRREIIDEIERVLDLVGDTGG